MGYLPDTNILINYLKGLEPEKSYLKNIISSEELLTLGTVISIDIKTALVAGNYRKQFLQKTKKLIYRIV